jgi:hypothetical protein
LKTKGSQRQIPLVGSALWAAKRIKEVNGASTYAFPRYNKTTTTNANSASAAINKWLRPRVPEGCVIHSFRHSLRDRLRAVECPSDMIDQIGGWATGWRRSGVWRWLRHRQEVGVVVGYHLREPDEQTTHAVTHRKARDNSELTWVSWEKVVPGGCQFSYALRQLKSPLSNISSLGLAGLSVNRHICYTVGYTWVSDLRLPWFGPMDDKHHPRWVRRTAVSKRGTKGVVGCCC